MYKLNTISKIALVLLLLGGINWGLIGLLNLNLFGFILGRVEILERIAYILVGVSSVFLTYIFFRNKSS